jgi:hypothetical protein
VDTLSLDDIACFLFDPKTEKQAMKWETQRKNKRDLRGIGTGRLSGFS